jgi:ABC-2 type transport system ATP-binding protein
VAALKYNGGYTMLTVQNLTKKYHNTLANDKVTFSAEEGKISIILGPNGAGKSTAIKCIMGLLRYDGEITIDGAPNKTLLAKSILGYVPEIPSLYDLLTVEEHMEFIARAYKLEGFEKYSAELLGRFELTDKRNKLARELSKGMQQKLSICCALLPRPKIIVFDEPLVGLDPHAIKEIKNIFVELRAQNRAIIISTHMIDSIEDIWDKAIIMSNGCILKLCERSEIEAQGMNLEQVFFGVTENGEEG